MTRVAAVDSLRQQAIIPTPTWADPLFTPGDQFRLSPPAWWWDGSEEHPTQDPDVRPFSLRGVVAGPAAETVHDGWTYEYDAVRQIGVARSPDGTVIEMNKHTKPGATPAATTGTTQDGDPRNPPPEEMGDKDFQTD
ncbi:MAG: putative ATP-grasp-modified RiPP [Pseudonocardia sp.]